MDRTAALDELPEAHAVALRLRDAGHDNTMIATALGIEIESVGPLLRIAQAKLSRLFTESTGTWRQHNVPGPATPAAAAIFGAEWDRKQKERTMTPTTVQAQPAQAPVTLADLSPYTARNGDTVNAGCYGVSHGSGLAGELIRHATESWAGHAFVYIGNGQIVEGWPPVARIATADSHPDAVFNAKEALTDDQQLQIVARAQALVGTPYDWPAYVGFALEILKLQSETTLDEVLRQDHWRVCSALVADCYAYAGITIDTALHNPNLVTPADLYNRLVQLP